MPCYRHGDVSFHPISREEADELIKIRSSEPKKNLDSFVVALGEVTGHKHVMTAERPKSMSVIELRNGEVLFELGAPAVMSHEEHHSFTMAPGLYIRKIEREFDPFERMSRRSED